MSLLKFSALKWLYFFNFTLKIIFNIDLLIFTLDTYSWAEQIRMDMCNLHISILIHKVWKFDCSNFLSIFKIVPHLIKWSGISNSCAEEEEVDWSSDQQDMWWKVHCAFNHISCWWLNQNDRFFSFVDIHIMDISFLSPIRLSADNNLSFQIQEECICDVLIKWSARYVVKSSLLFLPHILLRT